MKALIEKYDHIGRGIAYVNNKVTFVPKVVVGDYVDLEIIKEKKNYQEAKVIKIIKPSYVGVVLCKICLIKIL